VTNKKTLKNKDDFIRSFIIHLTAKYTPIPKAEIIKKDIAVSRKSIGSSALKFTELVEMKNRRIMFSG
jgi:hypothetical protein